MSFDVETSTTYDARFELALTYRLRYVGKASASRLLCAQEAVEHSLARFPYMGTPLKLNEENPGGDVPRWIKVGEYVAVYETYPEREKLVLEDLFYPSEDWRNRVSVEA